MKITVRQLRQIIKEEVNNVRRRNLNESTEHIMLVADYLEFDAARQRDDSDFPIKITNEELQGLLGVDINNDLMAAVKEELGERDVYGISFYPGSVLIYDPLSR